MALKDLFNRSEPGLWVSGAAHAALIAAAVITLAAERFPESQEGIPVEVFTDTQFSEITKGEIKAKEVQATQKPRADRVAEKTVDRDPGEDKRDLPAPPKRPAEMKVADQEVPVAAPAPASRPVDKPDPRQEEAAKAAEKAKAEAEAQQKLVAEKAEAEEAARQKAAEAKAKAETEAKRVAEAKAAAEAKAKADAEAKRVAEAKAKTEAEAKARKEAEAAKTLDLGDLRQFLNTKDKNQSTGATGAEVQKTASLGTATGTSQRLNPSMRDALAGILIEQMRRCYSAPVGATAGNVMPPVLDVSFNPDGSLATDPHIVKAGPTGLDRTAAETALRAVRRCAPYTIPPRFAPFYTEWKRWNVIFDVES